ncbi:SDR family oxidoreductase [Amnibacterium sp. CER49]|uniref:SDR family oxidoreductase n=1 Tax=Amnibacterium sp. CER49 TaxID=3039161 RepID=UPI0024471BBF|nr:SDR family oxidoreductase [Amnibacterium sp. CER49]MDH2444912.1 SDR family oxidoreductase [Amnibacterium sp. CER49]
MSTIAIVGGHGKVALLLAQALSRQGHRVRSLIRRTEQGADVEHAGAVPFLLDIEGSDVGDFADAFGRADAVVFSAGGGADGNAERKRTVDLEGSLKSIEAAERAGIRRFVQVSAMGVDEPLPDDTEPVWRAYVEAKRDADAALRDSGLDWTIVRPGRLTDGPATDAVEIGERLPSGDIARADVAALLVAVLEDDSTIGAQFEVTRGDTTISAALASLR